MISLKKINGFSLIEIAAVIVLIGILATVVIPRYVTLRNNTEEDVVETMISSLESAMAIQAAKEFAAGRRPVVHNPFDDLTNKPVHYNGVVEPINSINTPEGTWSFNSEKNWVIYNPQLAISGGWENDNNRFIVLQVELDVQYLDTVGIRLIVDPLYMYHWN